MVKQEKKRVNFAMSKELCDWYKEKARDMGSTMSFMMVLALKTFMDQQKALEMSRDMPVVLSRLSEMGFKIGLKKEEEKSQGV